MGKISTIIRSFLYNTANGETDWEYEIAAELYDGKESYEESAYNIRHSYFGLRNKNTSEPMSYMRTEEGQIFGMPRASIVDPDYFYITLTDLKKGKIYIKQFDFSTQEFEIVGEVNIEELGIAEAETNILVFQLEFGERPIFLYYNDCFTCNILWPEKGKFDLDGNESIERREYDLLFSKADYYIGYEESPKDYEEDKILEDVQVIRKFPTGEVIERDL